MRKPTRIPALFGFAVLASILSACSGSGSDTAPSVSRVQTFPDGSGTAVGTVQVGGEEVVFVGFSSRATDFDEFTNGSPGNTPPIEDRDLVYVSSNSNGDFYRFAVLYEGVTYTGVAYQESADKSILILGGDAAGYTFALAQADRLTNLPRSGVATYAGTNIIGSRDGLFSDVGTFSMVADFDKGIVNLDGSTPNSRIRASSIPINESKGTFEGFEGTLTVNGLSEPASVVGAFSGDEAFGVSGIYHDNDSDGSAPEYVGAFDG